MTNEENRPLILLADDEPDLLTIVARRLTVSGFRVVAVSDGHEAVDRVEGGDIDLAILDVSMPGLNGYQVCRRFRSDPATAHLPVIILTAKDAVTDRYWAEEVGANIFLTKPFDNDELLSAIRELLGRTG